MRPTTNADLAESRLDVALDGSEVVNVVIVVVLIRVRIEYVCECQLVGV